MRVLPSGPMKFTDQLLVITLQHARHAQIL
jgi:hypothetical protein